MLKFEGKTLIRDLRMNDAAIAGQAASAETNTAGSVRPTSSRRSIAEFDNAYTRTQAIEAGELVDLRRADLYKVVREAGYVCPLACSSAVFSECIDLTPAARQAGNDIGKRLSDVLWMMKNAITKRRGRPIGHLFFEVLVVRDRLEPTLTKLKVISGSDDNGAPCLTIMFADES